VGYFESKVEAHTAALELETNMTASSEVVSQEISNQEQYSADK
jgi:hypothetical protein